MRKSQTLPFDEGDKPGLRAAASWSTSLKEKHQTEEYCINNYTSYRSEANSVYSTGGEPGYQVFESTQNPRPAFNACSNRKLAGFNYPYCRITRRYNRATTVYVAPFTRKGMVGDIDDVRYCPPLDWGSAEGAARRAWWNMQPRFEGRIQLLNFIYELKDFRDIAKAMVKFKNIPLISAKARYLRGRIKDLFTKRGKTWTEMTTRAKMLHSGDVATKAAASLFLTKELAIDPLVSESMAIVEQLRTCVSDAQADFQRRGLTRQKSHYSEILFEDSELEKGSGNDYWFQTGVRQSLKFTATLDYTYQYKMRDPWDAAKKYWGLELTPEVIWNALPFTFVVDYFAKIGDSIHAMGTDPNVDLMTHQYCESLLYENSSGRFTTGDPRAIQFCINGTHVPGGVENYPLAGYVGSSYERRVSEPNLGSALPRLTLPSFKQSLIMGALVRCLI